MSQKILQHQQLHEHDAHFGTTALLQIPACVHLILLCKPASILDYGCGKGVLVEELQRLFPHIRMDGYDPAVPAFADRGRLLEKYDLIFNFDVLEHIPEDEIPGVLADMRSFGDRVFFHLAHAKASHTLPDGTNAHCTVKPPSWYRDLIGGVFSEAIPILGRSSKDSHLLTFSLSEEGKADFQHTVFAKKRRGEAITLFFVKWIPFRRWRKTIRAAVREQIVRRQIQNVLEIKP